MSGKLLNRHKRAIKKAIIEGNTDFIGKALRIDARLKSMSDENGYTLLHFAAENSTDTMVKFLLDRGLSVFKLTSFRQTALHLAVIASKYRVAKLLLDQCVSVTAADYSGRTALHYAVSNFYQRKSNSRKRIILLLIQRGASILAPTFHGETPFHLAIVARSEYLVHLLLRDQRFVHHLNSRGQNGETALHFAVQRSSSGVVKMLLDAGFNVRSTTEDGKTALHLAVSSETGSEKIVRLLIERGAIINHGDNQGNTPLFTAAHAIAREKILIQLPQPTDFRFSTNVIRILLAAGADVNHYNYAGEPVFHAALRTGQACIIEQFLERGVDVKCTHAATGYSSLHMAAKYGPFEIIKTLIDKGVPTEVRTTREGMTPLHVAVQGGSKIYVETLLANGADINALDFIGRTPLHYAALRSHLHMDILLARGADLLITAVTGDSPLDYVMRLLWNNNLIDTESTIMCLVRRLTLMEALGNSVATDVIGRGVRMDDKCRQIYEKHRSELESMKERKIDENISYFDMLSRNTKWIANFVRRPVFVDAFKYNRPSTIFPLYGYLTKKKYNEAEHIRDVTDASMENLLKYGHPKLPILVLEKIIDYCPLKDLEKFVKVCQGQETKLFVFSTKGPRPSGQGRTFSWGLSEEVLDP